MRSAEANRSPWLLSTESLLNLAQPPSPWLRKSVRPAAADIAQEISIQGLIHRPENALDGPLLDRAQQQLERSASIAAIVRAWVHEIYLVASTAGIDVSHSEPRWAHRIFVSIPERRDEVGALRLSENVIHEAMHLQLTGLEVHTPLVSDHVRYFVSPWREDLRRAGGILHGLFVFSGLSAFFGEIAAGLEGEEQRYVLRRMSDIRSEIASINLSELCAALTPRGAELARECHSWVLQHRGMSSQTH